MILIFLSVSVFETKNVNKKSSTLTKNVSHFLSMSIAFFVSNTLLIFVYSFLKQKMFHIFCQVKHFLSGQYFCFIFLSFICKPDIALTKKVSQRFSLSFLSEKIQKLTKTKFSKLTKT